MLDPAGVVMADTESKPSRRWVLTHWLKHNQTTEAALERLSAIGENEIVRYVVGQVEGPDEEGKYHLQGYVELTRAARLTQVKELLWRTTRWAPAVADGRTNKRYCTKTHEVPFEWPDEKIMRAAGTESVEAGDMGGSQGKRSDLDTVQRMLDEGEPMSAVASEFFGDYVRYHRGFVEYRKVKRQLNRGKPTVEVLHGPSATGKSLYCRSVHPPSERVFYLTKPNGNRVWWDGYDGHTTVIVDEFYGWMPYDFILRLLDYGPLTVETKGGAVNMVADHFVFTSNMPPERWYDLGTKPDCGSPFMRRLKEFAVVTETTSEYLDSVLGYIESEQESEEARAAVE